ncbi:MAG TPA: DUF2339 domain-containing protein, partial [Chitinophagaceae bacterium]|nr:DUF2339 domain-containing protein [Chitinophagaceae bacterium]
MEVFALLLFAILLYALFAVKRSITRQIETLSNDIRQLKNEVLAATEVKTPLAPAPPPVAPAPPAATPADNYWQTSFKQVDDASPETATPLQQEESTTNKDLPAIPTSIASKEPSPTAPVAKDLKKSFFERHPDLEKFIGENLVNKIGIAILVLAIGFFVKYAIDNNWIGPAGRVGIGILCGAILVALAHMLRANYKGFSSVLAGGGLAIFYFSIALGYHQFHLFSQVSTFVIMIVITGFAVGLSLLYNRQELAIIALAGGFATPFMASNGNGNYQVLFTYLLVLNSGLLVLAYYKSWRLLNALCFGLTTILFAGWMITLTGAAPAATYRNGFLFASGFYGLFFIINIAHNIKEKKRFIASDFAILLVNTSLYFAAGLFLLTAMDSGNYRGLFSASLGAVHLLVSFLLLRNQKVDKNILYLLMGITLTCISLTAPLQLHGNFITLFWSSEAVLLFWLYKRSGIGIIRYSSFIIWVAMLVSLLMDWLQLYTSTSVLPIVLNRAFITGVYSAAASALLFVLAKKENVDGGNTVLVKYPVSIFAIAALLIIYIAGLLEINHQFVAHYPGTGLQYSYLLLYTYAFVLLFLLLQRRSAAGTRPAQPVLLLSAACLLLYLLAINHAFTLLRTLVSKHMGSGHLTAHWLGDLLLLLLFVLLVNNLRKLEHRPPDMPIYTWLLALWAVIFLSAESYLFNNQLFYNGTAGWQSAGQLFLKAILPIIWGICSFVCMWLGMHYKYRTLRIISLILFSITLLKLFVFDIRNIPTGGKIAAFFCLGVLLLVVSFMYQRLKRILIEDERK